MVSCSDRSEATVAEAALNAPGEADTVPYAVPGAVRFDELSWVE